MIFTLEALQAAYGEALLLHWGQPQTPQLAVIDGGPRGVYRNVLEPRLLELRKNPKRLDQGRLVIRLMMVSHIDDDHVQGILELAKALADRPGPKLYAVESLWHNSFDDLLGNRARELAASVEPLIKGVAATGTLPPNSAMKNRGAALVMASVGQGRELRDAARKLGWAVNREMGGRLVCRPKTGTARVPIADGLTFTVLGPDAAEIDALGAEWDRVLREKGWAVDPAQAAAYADNSVFNLSSLVVLAELDSAVGPTRRMLLTGDARGDRILQGLSQAGLLQNGKCHVDLLKVPHHGSSHNVTAEFFKTVTADHYLISSNGERFDNPDRESLEWLAAARKGTGRFTIYLTYPPEEFQFNKRPTIQKDLRAFIKAGRASGAYTVICRKPPARSVSVHLADPPAA